MRIYRSDIYCLIVLLVFFFAPDRDGRGQVRYGANQYVEYRTGSLPIVISAPHGGSLKPTSIPDRSCPNITTGTDLNTIELVLQIDSSLFAITGCHAQVVLCRLHRNKLDVNREINEAACGNRDAEKAWSEYHGFIDTALRQSVDRYGTGFYIDLHGHGHAKQRIELGYGLTAANLRQSNSYLNTTAMVNASSIRNLAATNVNHLFHSSLLRGSNALGTLLGNAGYPAVPSSQIPSPDEGDEYYTGGYSTVVHTSIQPASVINGVQIECYRVGIRDTYQSRKAFADSVAQILIRYLEYHVFANPIICNSSTGDSGMPEFTGIFPNPCSKGEILRVYPAVPEGTRFQVFNLLGSKVQDGTILKGNEIRIDPSCGTGVFTVLVNTSRSQRHIRVLIHE
jgi:hypothetical protein